MARFKTSGFLDKKILEGSTSHAVSTYNGPLDGAIPDLFTGSPTLNKDVNHSSFTAPAYSGYAAGAPLTFNAPVREPDGSWSLVSPSTQFQATTASPFVPDTIDGMWLKDGATPPNVLGYAVFDNPIPLNVVGEGFSLTVVINQGSDDALSVIVIVE